MRLLIFRSIRSAFLAKNVTAALDGGRICSDGGVIFLTGAERRIGIIDRLWRLILDRRNPFGVGQIVDADISGDKVTSALKDFVAIVHESLFWKKYLTIIES